MSIFKMILLNVLLTDLMFNYLKFYQIWSLNYTFKGKELLPAGIIV